jgi:group I intron endonuclease
MVMKQKMIIYKITNLITNKIYIGQTIGKLKTRWNGHKNKFGKKNHIRNSIAKYGAENFTIEEIDRAENIEELNEKEVYWIDFYDARNPEKGYNIREGGANKTHREDSKLKMSISSTGKKHSAETIQKLKDRPITDEFRQKMSDTHKGIPRKKEHIEKFTSTFKKNRANHKHIKLTVEDVLEIRRLDKEGWSRKALSEKFGIGRTSVHYVIHKFNWKDIKDEGEN